MANQLFVYLDIDILDLGNFTKKNIFLRILTFVFFYFKSAGTTTHIPCGEHLNPYLNLNLNKHEFTFGNK